MQGRYERDQRGKTRASAMDSGQPIARHVRLCIAALVAALFVVPPLLSTLDAVSGPTTSSIRLNRAPAAPGAKGKSTRLICDVAVHSVVVHDEQGRARLVARAALDDLIPDSPVDRSPQTRRGPPNARLA